MKVKNRRSVSRVDMCSEERTVEYTITQQKTDTTGSGRRSKKTQDHRSSSKSDYKTVTQNSNNQMQNGILDTKLGKRKNVNGHSGCMLLSPSNFKTNSSVQSNSCSSASSIVSSSGGDAVDPYEFAVKSEEHIDCSSSNAMSSMKRMKLDRIDDRCRPGSSQSSPLVPTVSFTHHSPGENCSPLASHCTRPLSVCTDFSCSVNGRNIPDPDVQRTSNISLASISNSVRPYSHQCFENGSTLRQVGSSTSESSNHASGSNVKCHFPRADTPITAPAVDSFIVSQASRSPASALGSVLTPTTCGDHIIAQHSRMNKDVAGLREKRNNPSVSCGTSSVAKQVQQRCVGVNTVPEGTCKATITEPDLLGPCEPGTTISLNGIVWLETTTGVLVVNVTWRGRTYIGTLLDATQHDFAPPCPRDYVPPFKSTIRSSSRTKRRTGLSSSYKQQSSNSLTYQYSENSNKTSQRQRLRARNTGSPISVSTNANTAEYNSQSTSHQECTIVTDASTKVGQSSEDAPVGTDDENGQCYPPTISDEEIVTQQSTKVKTKRGSSASSSDCPSENLNDAAKLGDYPEVRGISEKECPLPVSQRAEVHDPHEAKCDDNAISSRGLDFNDTDEEIQSSYPIVCPIEGCKKRFTHVIALRFHLNHTRHETLLTESGKISKRGRKPSCRKETQYEETRIPDSPPSISPPCVATPTPPSDPPTMPPPRPQAPSFSDTHHQLTNAGIFKHLGLNDPSVMNSPGSIDSFPPTAKDNIHKLGIRLSASTPDNLKAHPVSAKCYPFPVSSGQEYGVPTPHTRTVTAHTVAIPHGTSKCEKNWNGSRPIVSTASSGKRPTSNTRTDSIKQRVVTAKISSTSRQDRIPVTQRNTTVPNFRTFPPSKEHIRCPSPSLPHITPDAVNFHSPALGSSGCSELSCASQTTNSLSLLSREALHNAQNLTCNTIPFSLPPGVWNFSNHSQSDPRLMSSGVKETDNSYSSSGLNINSGYTFLNRSPPTSSPSSHFDMRSSESIPHNKYNYAPTNNTPISRPGHQSNNPTKDPSQFYGFQDFLLAAAMGAFGANAFTNPSASEAFRSLGVPHSSGFSKIPSLPPPTASQVPPSHSGNGTVSSFKPDVASSMVLPGASQLPAPLLSLINCSTNTGSNSGGNSIQSSTQSAAPVPPMHPSFLHSLGLLSSGASNQGSGSDRLDPFKLSAAYLMQHAAASGAQLPSNFGHPHL